MAPDAKLMAVPFVAGSGVLEPGTPTALFQTRDAFAADADAGPQYDVARDGHLLIRTLLSDAVSPITILQNWRPPAR